MDDAKQYYATYIRIYEYFVYYWPGDGFLLSCNLLHQTIQYTNKSGLVVIFHLFYHHNWMYNINILHVGML